MEKIALWDFFPQNDSCVALTAGDLLIVLDASNPEWILVDNLTKKRDGYVPFNYIGDRPPPVPPLIEKKEMSFGGGLSLADFAEDDRFVEAGGGKVGKRTSRGMGVRKGSMAVLPFLSIGEEEKGKDIKLTSEQVSALFTPDAPARAPGPIKPAKPGAIRPLSVLSHGPQQPQQPQQHRPRPNSSLRPTSPGAKPIPAPLPPITGNNTWRPTSPSPTSPKPVPAPLPPPSASGSPLASRPVPAPLPPAEKGSVPFILPEVGALNKQREEKRRKAMEARERAREVEGETHKERVMRQRRDFLKDKADDHALREARETEKKRIESQLYSFKEWINFNLGTQCGIMRVEDIARDLGDGLVLIALYEKLTGKSVGKYSQTPTKTAQKINNLSLVLNLMKKEGILTGDIGPSDILKGNEKVVLGMTWQVVRHFGEEGMPPYEHGEYPDGGGEFDYSLMIAWVNSYVTKRGIEVKDLDQSFQSGVAFASLLAQFDPDFPAYAIVGENAGIAGALHNAALAFDYALKVYGVPKLIRLEDLFYLHAEAVYAYLSLIQKAFGGGSSSHEITHTVFLVGDAANLRCSLIGKRVEGIWRRGQGNEGREGAGGNVDVDSVVVLLKDFATGRHLPVRGIPFMISGDEIGFWFIADQLGTIGIEVFHVGDYVGATYVEICEPLVEEIPQWTQDMIQSMEEEDKVGLYDEYRALLLNKQGQLNRDGGVFTDWGDEGMGDANAMRRRRRRKMVGADGVEYEEEEEGEEEEEALRLPNGISPTTEKLVVCVMKDNEEGNPGKELKTFPVKKEMTINDLETAAARKMNKRPAFLAIFEDIGEYSTETFQDPDLLPQQEDLSRISGDKYLFDELIQGNNLYLQDDETGSTMKITPYDHDHYVQTKEKIMQRRKRLTDVGESYVQINMENDEFLFALWRPGGAMVVPITTDTQARDVRKKILANMDASVGLEPVSKRIREYVHWWLIAVVQNNEKSEEKVEDKPLKWGDSVWPWRIGHNEDSSLAFKMCYRYFKFSIRYPSHNHAVTGEPFLIKIRAKDPRNNHRPADKCGGVLEAVFVDTKEHNMIVVDATPTSETGLFVLKFIPKKSGTHLAMIRFNGENLQHKWAKIHVSSDRSIAGIIKKQTHRRGEKAEGEGGKEVGLGGEPSQYEIPDLPSSTKKKMNKRASVSLPLVRKNRTGDGDSKASILRGLFDGVENKGEEKQLQSCDSEKKILFEEERPVSPRLSPSLRPLTAPLPPPPSSPTLRPISPRSLSPPAPYPLPPPPTTAPSSRPQTPPLPPPPTSPTLRPITPPLPPRPAANPNAVSPRLLSSPSPPSPSSSPSPPPAPSPSYSPPPFSSNSKSNTFAGDTKGKQGAPPTRPTSEIRASTSLIYNETPNYSKTPPGPSTAAHSPHLHSPSSPPQSPPLSPVTEQKEDDSWSTRFSRPPKPHVLDPNRKYAEVHNPSNIHSIDVEDFSKKEKKAWRRSIGRKGVPKYQQ